MLLAFLIVLFTMEEGLFVAFVRSVVYLVGRKCDCAKQTYAEQITLIIATRAVDRACA